MIALISFKKLLDIWKLKIYSDGYTTDELNGIDEDGILWGDTALLGWAGKSYGAIAARDIFKIPPFLNNSYPSSACSFF